MEDLKKYIRNVPDFPKPGILFYDITTLLESPEGLHMALDRMEEYAKSKDVQTIVAIESRGFIFGSALADRLGLGVAVARKPGKLPYKTISEEYELEYGTDRLELHEDAVRAGQRALIVDDLIATGGTIKAACKLIERLGGEVAGVSVVIDLAFLPWREALKKYDVNYLVSYDSE